MDTVFKRTKKDSPGKIISSNMYNMTIGLVLAYGFTVNWLMVKNIPVDLIVTINPFLFVGGYILSCGVGVYLFVKSENPFVSFLGYNFVVVPFGLIINVVVSQYEPELVLEAMRVTGMVTIVMMLLGTLFPKFFQKIVGTLTVALFVVIIIETVEIILLKSHHGITDFIVVAIFCGYIGYDWGRANSIPKTVDNAVDSAASLYMDIIILFLRILRILSRR